MLDFHEYILCSERKGSLFCKCLLVLLKSDFCNFKCIPVSSSMLITAMNREGEHRNMYARMCACVYVHMWVSMCASDVYIISYKSYIE